MTYNMYTTASETLTDLLKTGEELVGNFWNLLDHPDFPFVNLNSTTNGARNFPPYNIIEQKDGKVRLEMAVAGYKKEFLTVDLEGNVLLIKGTAPASPSNEVSRYKGISGATFLRTFDMNTYTIVESVELKDGILMIVVSTKKPEDTKRTSFSIK